MQSALPYESRMSPREVRARALRLDLSGLEAPTLPRPAVAYAQTAPHAIVAHRHTGHDTILEEPEKQPLLQEDGRLAKALDKFKQGFRKCRSRPNVGQRLGPGG